MYHAGAEACGAWNPLVPAFMGDERKIFYQFHTAHDNQRRIVIGHVMEMEKGDRN